MRNQAVVTKIVEAVDGQGYSVDLIKSTCGACVTCCVAMLPVIVTWVSLQRGVELTRKLSLQG